MRMRRRGWSLSGQVCLPAALLSIAGAVLWGCGRETGYGTDSAQATAAACAVTDEEIDRWIRQPSIPPEPAGVAASCFFNFAWQELFAVTQRAQGNVPTFATWPNDQELFTPAGKEPIPWKIEARKMRGRPLRKGLGLPGAGGVIADQVAEAAALTPLVDRTGRWAHFSVVINQPEYEYVRCCELYKGGCFNSTGCDIDLPDGSLELKLAWRELDQADPRYLTVNGEVQVYSPDDPDNPIRSKPAILGLVGMHIVHWTKQNPGAMWATFEHVDNAPDCLLDGTAPSSAPPPPGFSEWAFYKPGCDPQTSPSCAANSYCLPCPLTVSQAVVAAFNKAHPKPAWQIDTSGVITCTPVPHEFNRPITLENGDTVPVHLFNPTTCNAPPIPSQVCRTVPIRDDVKALNGQVRKALRQLGGNAAALANYELVGVQWFDHGKALQPASGTALANTTMETYLQDPKLMPTGCVLCHTDQGTVGGVNPVPGAPPMQFNSGLADRSMVFQQIRQLGNDSKCGTDQAAKCGAWREGCPGKK